MRAISYTRFGPADEVLTLGDLPTPDPAPGEVLVRLATSGVNPSDIRARAGGRPGVTEPPFPVIVPHSDGAGVIEAVGEGVDPGRIGQRVWIEFVTVPRLTRQDARRGIHQGDHPGV